MDGNGPSADHMTLMFSDFFPLFVCYMQIFLVDGSHFDWLRSEGFSFPKGNKAHPPRSLLREVSTFRHHHIDYAAAQVYKFINNGILVGGKRMLQIWKI
jgi:hypothetical protein